MLHRDTLIGQWHRSEKNEFDSFSEFAELFADGRFSFTFYTYNLDGTLLEQITELGDWGLVGDIHFTITKCEVENGIEYPADMLNEDNYQAYKVLTLSEQEFTYQHVVSGETFSLSRVATSTN